MRSLFLFVVVCIFWLLPAALPAQTPPSSPSVAQGYYALGEFNHRGVYSFPKDEKVTVLDLLNAAGGQTPLANMKGAKIWRIVDSRAKLISVDFMSLTKKGLAEANIPMLPGDVLYLPERGRKALFWVDAPLPTDMQVFPIRWLGLWGFRVSFLH